MNWKEFFKPTVGKLIVPLVFLILVIYYDLFSPIFGKLTLLTRFIMAITNISHLIFVIILLAFLYFVSCSIYIFINKFKNQKPKK